MLSTEPDEAARVAVVTVAYNTGQLLVDCVRAVVSDPDSPPLEMVIVNNGDPGPELDEVSALGVRVIESGGNVGFAAGCNLGASSTSAPVLLFLNPDTRVGAGAIRRLADVVEGDESIGSAVALLRLADDPARLMSSGNLIHVTGSGWSGGFGELASSVTRQREVTYCCGAAMAIRRQVFDEVGRFCEELFLYHEDLELGWRVRLAGYKAVIDPNAVVDHVYDFGRNALKFHYIERNRLVFLATCFPAPLLAAAVPVALGFELAILAMATRQGWLKDKLRGWGWVLSHIPWIVSRRRTVLAGRRVPVSLVATWITPRLDPAMIDLPAGVNVVNRVLEGYWAAVRWVVARGSVAHRRR